MGDVAYKLELPEGSKIHNTFHVSLLKRAIGKQDISSIVLRPLDDEGRLVLISKRVLETRIKKLRLRQIQEYLIKWKDLPYEDSTWEGVDILTHPSLSCLRESNLERGGLVTSSMSSSH